MVGRFPVFFPLVSIFSNLFLTSDKTIMITSLVVMVDNFIDLGTSKLQLSVLKELYILDF
jgi:hypothetical protein